ncbi:MAG: LysE family translocator [Granulosicoccaceae bacterium]
MISHEFLLTSLVVCAIPGTGVIYTLSAGLFLGPRAVLMAVIGCTLGILPQLLASVLGLAAIWHTSALAFQALKLVGVAYLLYLAWSMWRHSGVLQLDKEAKSQSDLQVAIRAFLINILNPKLSLFFLAFLPQFVDENAASPLAHSLLLGGVFMALTAVVFLLYGLLAHSLSRAIVGSERASRWIQRGFSASFAALGARLALAEK